jgi:hypothetical protein
MKYLQFIALAGFILFAGVTSINAQNLLSRNVPQLTVNAQRLDNVLEILSNKGDFYFSYSSSVVRKDSLVSLNVSNKTVREVLNLLFNNTYEFRESGSYIIIRKAPIRLIMVTSKAVTEEKQYAVSGYVYDEQSGTAINEASIYEKKLLTSTLTDEKGYFRLRLKSGKASSAELTISKEFYSDTTVLIEPRHNQELSITLMPMENTAENIIVSPQDLLLPDSLKPRFEDDILHRLPVVRKDTVVVERTGAGRFLLTTKQKVQSLNLKNFFTERPFQVSVVPGVGTHGRIGAQVVNNFSLNMFGGYTAGTNGLEIGGLFNIDKKDVQYVQAAGLFNAVGGQVKGVQVAGINNTVLDSVKGVQASGIGNLVKGNMTGLQMGGIYNHVTDSVKGVQAAGIGNFARRKVSGMQIAGIMNFSNKSTDGVQIAGVINYSKRLRGVQIGLINIADTSSGYSIGLINIILKGYHKLSISSNDVLTINAAFKTGNSKLYSILLAGLSSGLDSKIYSFGYGLGSEIPLTKKKNFSFNPELTVQHLYLGSWNYTNILNRISLNLNYKVNKYISLFAGPSYSVLLADQESPFSGFRSPLDLPGGHLDNIGKNVSGWLGWNAGINLF